MLISLLPNFFCSAPFISFFFLRLSIVAWRYSVEDKTSPTTLACVRDCISLCGTWGSFYIIAYGVDVYICDYLNIIPVYFYVVFIYTIFVIYKFSPPRCLPFGWTQLQYRRQGVVSLYLHCRFLSFYKGSDYLYFRFYLRFLFKVRISPPTFDITSHSWFNFYDLFQSFYIGS